MVFSLVVYIYHIWIFVSKHLMCIYRYMFKWSPPFANKPRSLCWCLARASIHLKVLLAVWLGFYVAMEGQLNYSTQSILRRKATTHI